MRRGSIALAGMMMAAFGVLGCDREPQGVTLGPPADWLRTARPEQLYLLQCARCHGTIELVEGRVRVGISHHRVLVVGPWMHAVPRGGETEGDAVARIVLEGIPGTEMIGFTRGLSDTKAKELAGWILELRSIAARNIEQGASPEPALEGDERDEADSGSGEADPEAGAP